MRGTALLALVATVVLAGCLAGFQPTRGGPDASPTEPLPSPPGQLNATSAEAFALEYERVRLTNLLADEYGTESSGVGCCTASTFATTVVERSGTYYVRVQYPYYYETAAAETDAVAHAIFAVTPDAVTRIDLRARTVSVEDRYGAPNHTDNDHPPRIYLVNAVDDRTEASVKLTHLGWSETAFDRTLELDANASAAVSQVVSRKGEYRLSVSTGGRTGQHRFTIPPSREGAVFAIFTHDGSVLGRFPRETNESVASA